MKIRPSTTVPDPARERRTRARVVQLLLESGPSTAAQLAATLGLSTAAIRRHLDGLETDGSIVQTEAVPAGPRGRGRPARLFALTDAGRDALPHAYDDLATSALRYLAEQGGEQAVREFARSRVADLERRYSKRLGRTPAGARAELLAQALSEDGYAATASVESAGAAMVCQHHCPVQHVAEEFPQLCEAETEVFSRLLGTEVTRLTTIAHGDSCCTASAMFLPMPTRKKASR